MTSNHVTYRVVRDLIEYVDEETNGMAYVNRGPFDNRQMAEVARATLLEDEAKYALNLGSYSEKSRIEGARRAANILNALANGFHDDVIVTNDTVRWTIRPLGPVGDGCRGCSGTCCTGVGSDPCTCD